MATEVKIKSKHRKLKGVWAAKLTADTLDALTYDAEVRKIMGASEMSNDQKTSTDITNYDDEPSVIIDSEDSPTVKFSGSAMSEEDRAFLNGQNYDTTDGCVSETLNAERPYLAIGYMYENTDGTKVMCWFLKGKVTSMPESHKTKSGTDSNGDEFEYTPISTIHKFTETGENAYRFKVSQNGTENITMDEFFSKVYDIDRYKEFLKKN
jgi:phi13 family phage major tail protein